MKKTGKIGKFFNRRNKLIIGFILLIILLFIIFVLPKFIDDSYKPKLEGELKSLGVGVDETCVPDCSNQACGVNSDGCGGKCECPVNYLCNQYTFECDSIE